MSQIKPARTKIRNFRDLDVWKTGKQITLTIYKATSGFPSNEQYGLVAQMRRSAVSIPSNIAEGFNRFTNKDYKHFLFMALGSCAELETQIEISKDLTFCTKEVCDELLALLVYEEKMLRALVKKLNA